MPPAVPKIFPAAGIGMIDPIIYLYTDHYGTVL
jgi:hypothetical protein